MAPRTHPGTSSRETPRVNISGVSCGIAAALSTALVFLVMLAAIPPTVVTGPPVTALRPIVAELLPQGWAFFTKPVDSEVIRVTAITEGHFREITAAPGAALSSLWGWDRRSRLQGLETTGLLTGITHEEWTPCQSTEIEACANAASTAQTHPESIRSTLSRPTLCGEIVVVAGTITHWEYRYLTPQTFLPQEALALHIDCASS